MSLSPYLRHFWLHFGSLESQSLQCSQSHRIEPQRCLLCYLTEGAKRGERKCPTNTVILKYGTWLRVCKRMDICSNLSHLMISLGSWNWSQIALIYLRHTESEDKRHLEVKLCFLRASCKLRWILIELGETQVIITPQKIKYLVITTQKHPQNRLFFCIFWDKTLKKHVASFQQTSVFVSMWHSNKLPLQPSSNIYAEYSGSLQIMHLVWKRRCF